jgi:hypothetical protein
MMLREGTSDLPKFADQNKYFNLFINPNTEINEIPDISLVCMNNSLKCSWEVVDAPETFITTPEI